MKLKPEIAAAAIAKAKAREDAARRRSALADHRSELTRSCAEHGQRRAEQAEARTELAKTRTEQAEIRTEKAETRTEHAKTRAENAETRAENAETRAEQAEARTELAEAIVEKVLSMPAGPAGAGSMANEPAPVRAPAVEDEADRRALEHLTARQRDVLQLLASGHNTKETAAKLDLSPKTVEYHRLRLMRTLDVHDLAGLVRFAVRVGLVPPGP